MSEFAFELALCSQLERERNAIVARQLGGGVHDPGGRVLDTVLVEPGPEFDQRAAITDQTIPNAAIDAAVGPGRFRPQRDALDSDGSYAERTIDRAVDIGFFERRRIDGAPQVRQVTRYPDDWFGELIAIEHKPDLGRPGALKTQLRTDVSLGLADQVVLATASYITGAHCNRLPEEVGLWRIHRKEGSDAEGPEIDIEVLREAEQLPVDEPGVELLDRAPGKASIQIASADEKQRARRQIAERAYGKGWRTYDLPACSQIDPTPDGRPYCAWAGDVVDPASDCGPDCPGHDPADPPAVDADTLRAERSPWVADPDGCTRRQSGLDRFL